MSETRRKTSPTKKTVRCPLKISSPERHLMPSIWQTKDIILFFLILLLISFIFIWVRDYSSKIGSSEFASSSPEFALISSQTASLNSYQQSLSQIMNHYLAQQSVLVAKEKSVQEWLALLEATKSQVLDLNVPSEEYKNLHLEFVLGLETIRQGLAAANQIQVEEGMERLFFLTQGHPWLVE